jgi:hypothetical protein
VAVGADRCVGEKGMDTEGLERICVYNVTLALSIDDLLKRPKQLMCKPYGHPIVGVLAMATKMTKMMMRSATLQSRKLEKKEARRRCTDGTTVSHHGSEVINKAIDALVVVFVLSRRVLVAVCSFV